MNKRRNSSGPLTHGTKTFAVLLVQIIAIIAVIALLLGVVAKHADISPPKETNSTIEYETTTKLDTQAPNEPTINIVEKETESVSTAPSIETEAEPTIPEKDSQEVTEATTQLEYGKPEESTEITFQEEPEIVPEVPKEPVGTVYLTFDDGPSTQITSKILDILLEKDVKATFFILDYAYNSEREDLVIREFNEGHTVALHGTSHDYSKIYTSLEALIENFTTLQEKVYNSTGYEPTIIRFPGGSSNTVSKNYCQGIMTEAVKYFSDSEFVYFDWNVDSQDAGGVKSTQELYENVISGIKPGRNNIVLMHDSATKKFTLEALEAIIDYCISEGYEFKAITTETPQVIHNVAN